jgi:ankyrin repeat protein
MREPVRGEPARDKTVRSVRLQPDPAEVTTIVVVLVTALVFSSAAAFAAGPPLIDAIRSRDAARIKALLASKVDVNAPYGDGATALHWAVHLDDASLVDTLLRAGARQNVVNDLGVTPLYLSCTNRNGAMTERLLAAGANPNATLANGESVLMNCARTGSVQGVRALLARGANPNAREKAHDQTALMWAAAERHPDAVAALLAAGADVKARSSTYIQTVTSEVTQRLGREELNYDVPRGGMTPIMFAARSGDAAAIGLLVGAGADVNDALPNGMSALTLAAHSGHTDAAIALLDKGADPNDAAVGYSPLHAAVLRSDLALVRALLARKANPNVALTKGTPLRRNNQDWNLPGVLVGITPFALAAKFLEPEILKTLAAGAETTLRTPDGTTPLLLAAGLGAANNLDRRGLSILDGGKVEPESRVVATVGALIELGADPTAVNRAGDSPAHAAAAAGYDQVLQLLAAKGANLSLRNERDLTPLGVLLRRKPADERQSTIELLKKLGATE